MASKCFPNYRLFARTPMVFPHKGPVMHNFDKSLLLSQTSCWTNSQLVCDLKSCDTHGVTVMMNLKKKKTYLIFALSTQCIVIVNHLHCWFICKCDDHQAQVLYTRFVLNSLAPGRCSCNLKWVIFKLISRIDLECFQLNYHQVNATRPHWWLLRWLSARLQ